MLKRFWGWFASLFPSHESILHTGTPADTQLALIVPADKVPPEVLVAPVGTISRANHRPRAGSADARYTFKGVTLPRKLYSLYTEEELKAFLLAAVAANSDVVPTANSIDFFLNILTRRGCTYNQFLKSCGLPTRRRGQARRTEDETLRSLFKFKLLTGTYPRSGPAGLWRPDHRDLAAELNIPSPDSLRRMFVSLTAAWEAADRYAAQLAATSQRVEA